MEEKISVKDRYSVKPTSTQSCKDWIIGKHYAHRMPPIEYAIGLHDEKNIIVGVITFGTPLSSKLRTSFGDKYKLMELNRLCVDDGLEKNVLSFFVSQSLQMLPKPLVVVSYADSSQNHHGYIYQATNFVYTGLSVEFKDYAVVGLEHLHGQSIMDMSRGKENRVEWLRDTFGDKLYMKERPRKHRYFYFLGDKRQKKEMLKLLPYKQEPYPKGDNVRYDSSYQPLRQQTLF